MTPHNDPAFFLIEYKGYRYPQMCYTNVAIALTISVYAVQSPQSIATYLIMLPDPGRGSIQNPNNPFKFKASK